MGARPTHELSKRLVTSILLINISLCKQNLVVLFQTICINISKCPKNSDKMGKTAKKLTIFKTYFLRGLNPVLTNLTDW